ncbi:MAG: DUF3857 domain-containing protein [Bacteroidota bacterium]|nr:DUF3857 domain-containing protein [Bacteroidota bacterium]
MRKLPFTALLLLSFSVIFAQKEIPKFGDIDKADLELKECEFDKDAAAYKLLSIGDVSYDVRDRSFTIITDKRVRIKVLKEKGLERANVKIQYYSASGYELIRGIAGVTYNLDNGGQITKTKLDKSSIYIKKINNRLSEVSFTLPDVKVGSVFEYKFTDEKKSIENVPDWYFQDDIPTRYSSFTTKVPTIFRFVSQMLAYQQVEQKKETVNDNIYYGSTSISNQSDEKTYIMQNIPALQDEPYMSAEKDYLQRVVSQLSRIDYPDGRSDEVMSTWPKLTEELLNDEDFGLQLKKNLPHTKDLDDALKNVTDDYQRMFVIHDYVRKNMNWNGSENIYSSDGIKSAWDKKSGSNAELNFILIDLLRDAGLKAFPLLVSTKDNGTVNTIYPFLDQFNNTMTCVLIGNKRYVLNAADKYNPANLIPYDVLNNEAFVVDKEYGGWIRLTNSKDRWKNFVSIYANIDSSDLMEGKATIYSYGYSKNPRVKQWEEDKSSFKDRFTKSFSAMKVKDIEVKNENVDTLPLEQKLDFSLPLSSSGEYKYFTLNLFQGLEKNPFIDDNRKTDIDFNYPKFYTIMGKIDIPEGYQFEELPQNIKMIMPDTSIVMERLIQQDDNSINFRITLNFAHSYYPASSYPAFHEFYKQLFSKLNEQIVIKKKTNT